MRKADIFCALCLSMLAIVVAWDALTLNIGWGRNGPQGGFFPFWLAVGLLICALVILGQALWSSTAMSPQPLVPPGGWRPLLSVVLPATVMVGLMELIGLYAAVMLYLAFSMRRLGQYGWPFILAVSIGAPLGSYFLFDKCFLIPMPRGLWGERLGL